MDTRTDRELVRGLHPGALVLSRKCPLTWATQYRVAHASAPGQAAPEFPWCPNVARAWRFARLRLGLRASPG
jgi:hypothetical protein